MPTSTFSTPGTYNVSIPDNGYSISVTVRGARGGTGGTDASAQGGVGGRTTQQTFTINQNFQARTFTCYVGNNGGNGQNNAPNATGGSGGSGMASGGRGGNAGDPPYSGGGGGGGGASGLQINGVNVICMGGAGGGGGASDNRNGGGGGVQSVNATASGNFNVSSGGQGGDPGGTDGGGGGGGGGGAGGGNGGGPGRDNSNGGGGGQRGGSRYHTSYCQAGSASYNQSAMDGYVQVSWLEAAPQINSFSAAPNPQNSSTGNPQYSTTLTWTTTYATSVTLTSSAGENFGSQALDGNYNITNLPQSTAGSNSPATRTYYLTATNDGGSTTSNVTVSARNDNVPNSNWITSTSFTNLEPSTQVTLTLGNISGIDMPTEVSTSGSGNFIGSGGAFSGSQNFTNGNTVQLRTTTLPFNTDISGQTGIYGKVNNKTVTVSYPGGSKNITIGTRAPVIAEDFNYANNVGNYPYEDIDLITNSPDEYALTAQIDADDIEIPMEIKVDQPDAQISINNGSWQNVREI